MSVHSALLFAEERSVAAVSHVGASFRCGMPVDAPQCPNPKGYVVVFYDDIGLIMLRLMAHDYTKFVRIWRCGKVVLVRSICLYTAVSLVCAICAAFYVAVPFVTGRAC